MDRVDGRDSQLMSGQTPEDSSFRTVGMHDLRLVVGKSSPDGSQGSPVLKRVQTAPEFRKKFQVQSSVHCSLFERTFRTKARSGHETDFVTKQVMLVVHTEKRILLRTTDDQPGNNVGNAHRGFWLRNRTASG